mmetsp:Transcript_11557/g.34178  ORF Transcript_11557/g.34178 Transcript_11557/m.34178 type:complete len:107 (-) Transcript_11557:2403-2723(-)
MPSLSRRAACGPTSATAPRSSTTICAALTTVERRCATRTTVFPPSAFPQIRSSSARWTSDSDSASSAEVASSSKRSRGLRSRQRAMASRCRWPPERRCPRSPTLVR